MSRNLCKTECDRCGTERLALEEGFRPITRAEAGKYFDEYDGMRVAKAYCPTCGAQYLAWEHYPWEPVPEKSPHVPPYVDLSFRSTFNDEPGEEDLPYPRILERLNTVKDARVSIPSDSMMFDEIVALLRTFLLGRHNEDA